MHFIPFRDADCRLGEPKSSKQRLWMNGSQFFSHVRAFLWVALCVGLSVASCMKAPDPSKAGVAQEAGDPIEKLGFPSTWKRVTPDLNFYLAKWEIPGEDPGVVTLTEPLGGTLDDNLNRWLDQVQVAEGTSREAAEIAELEGTAYPTTTIVLPGTFTATRGLGGGPPRENWLLVGAFVETANGIVSFKAVGPYEVLEPSIDVIWQALQNLRP